MIQKYFLQVHVKDIVQPSAFAEVEPKIEVKVSEEVVCGEPLLAVVVRMEYCACSGIPTVVVPHQSEASHTIDVEVANVKVFEQVVCFVAFAHGLLVSESQRQ